VGLPAASESRARAAADGFEVATAAEAARSAEVAVMLAADEDQARIWREEIAPNLPQGGALVFAHGPQHSLPTR
jgi:ketol-acid reductoisomerase